MYCPNCGSKDIEYGQRGFSWRNGIIGALFLGDGGILAGFLGSRDTVFKCRECGYEWKAEE